MGLLSAVWEMFSDSEWLRLWLCVLEIRLLRLQRFMRALLFSTAITFPLATALPAHAQRIVDVTPAVSAQSVSADALVSGLFEESGGTVDTTSVRLTVDGQDVTSDSSITSNFFSYRPTTPFSPGQHQVQLEYTNTQGQQRVASWSFSVETAQPTVAITSVTHNAIEPLATDATLLTTISGTPGLQASVLLVENGNVVRTLQAQEVSPGVYVASYSLQSSSNTHGIAVGQLTQGEQVIYAAAEQPIMISATAQSVDVVDSSVEASTVETAAVINLQPEFTSHTDGADVSGEGFTLVGQTQPGAMVSIRVDAATPVVGGFLNIGSSELVNRTVTADADGNFTVAVPAPLVVADGTKYSIEATARVGDTTSPMTKLTLVQQ